MEHFTIALIMFLSTLGPCIVITIVGYSAVKSLGRNPSAAPQILTSMIAAFLFAAGIAILGLLVVYLLYQ